MALCNVINADKSISSVLGLGKPNPEAVAIRQAKADQHIKDLQRRGIYIATRGTYPKKRILKQSHA